MEKLYVPIIILIGRRCGLTSSKFAFESIFNLNLYLEVECECATLTQDLVMRRGGGREGWGWRLRVKRRAHSDREFGPFQPRGWSCPADHCVFSCPSSSFF